MESAMREKVPSLFPRPQKLEVRDDGLPPIIPSRIFCTAKKGDRSECTIVKDWCKTEGYTFTDSAEYGMRGMLCLNLVKESSADTLYSTKTSSLSAEKYLLDIRREGEGCTAEIRYGSLSGLRHALSTIAMLIRGGGIIPCSIEDFPDFSVRGIIEGFYGKPWSPEERIDMFSLLERYKMNTYVYGPKDDPYHRDLWREPYDTASLLSLKRLYEAARAKGLDFWYSVGPGLSLCYSRKNDIDSLERKFLQVEELGIMNFGLFLDDIPERLQYPEDREAYSDLVSAHIALCSELFSRLTGRNSSIRFCVCPTQYHGRGNEYYISRLGQGLDPLIDIFWTGPRICSPELRVEDAVLFRQSTLHTVLYWDNYPVNDLEMSNELHIGPYSGRDRELYRFSRGIVANGMEYPEASKIPFITIACFLWNSGAYEPESCFAHAVLEVAGKRDAADFLLFAENVRSSCLCSHDAEGIARTLEDFSFAYAFGDREKAFQDVYARLSPYRKAAERLSSGLENERLGMEVRRWLETYTDGIELLFRAIQYVQNQDQSAYTALEAEYNAYMEEKPRVFADVVYPFIARVVKG